jgi:hypothetical protein
MHCFDGWRCSDIDLIQWSQAVALSIHPSDAGLALGLTWQFIPSDMALNELLCWHVLLWTPNLAQLLQSWVSLGDNGSCLATVPWVIHHHCSGDGSVVLARLTPT